LNFKKKPRNDGVMAAQHKPNQWFIQMKEDEFNQFEECRRSQEEEINYLCNKSRRFTH
jgi:hypothetical protein